MVFWPVKKLETRRANMNANEIREEQARERIRAAVQLLTGQGRKVTGREIQRLTRCSFNTLMRHMDIFADARAESRRSRAAGSVSQ